VNRPSRRTPIRARPASLLQLLFPKMDGGTALAECAPGCIFPVVVEEPYYLYPLLNELPLRMAGNVIEILHDMTIALYRANRHVDLFHQGSPFSPGIGDFSL
jgi:hypothetical protein